MRSLLALVLSAFALTATAQPPAIYTFGVTPQFEQRRLYATWKPILDAVEKRTGVRFRFMSEFSVPKFEQSVARGAFDFIYVSPYHIYAERSRQGYMPLVRDQAPLYGIVVVRRDSPLQGVPDLAGKSLAVPSPNAIGASMLVRADLERGHGVRMTLVNAKSHSSAYLHVVNKLAEAAGGVEKTLAEQSAAIQGQLRTLFKTRDFPSHPIAAHPRVPEALREQVRQAFLDLSATPDGKRLLGEIPMSNAVAASLRDYQVFRALDLDAYWVPPAASP